MVLVDTSVWIDHFRRGNAGLAALLEEQEVLGHPFILGELACGDLRKRSEILTLMSALPQAGVAEHDEVLHLLEAQRIHGKGLGWVDAHLLASALLSGCTLWTLDRPLQRVAAALEIAVH